MPDFDGTAEKNKAVKKKEAKLTVSHGQYAYRCFLPDLAGFGNIPLHRT